MGRRQPPPVTPEPALIPEEAMLLGGALLAASVVHVLTKRLSSSKRLVVRVGATFGISYVLGVRFLAGIKAGLGVDALGDLDAFGPLWTLSGLLFSVMLGQTYQYYRPPGRDPDAAFEETLALWRLSQLVTTTITDLHARRSAYVLAKSYAEQLSAWRAAPAPRRWSRALETSSPTRAVGLSAAADLLVEFDLGNDEPSQLGDACASRARVGRGQPFEGSWAVSPAAGSLEKFVAHMLEKHATLVRAHSKRAVTQVRASLRLAGTGNGVASLRKSADEASFSEKGGM
ncbi:hypothetical protein JL721_4061 [Aureococcus anophagefferens]|nr:hypothetical protein JL721_4061 [Aureococcus anophagefferens]